MSAVFPWKSGYATVPRSHPMHHPTITFSGWESDSRGRDLGVRDPGYEGQTWNVSIENVAGAWWIIAPHTTRFIDMPFDSWEAATLWLQLQGDDPEVQFESANQPLAEEP